VLVRKRRDTKNHKAAKGRAQYAQRTDGCRARAQFRGAAGHSRQSMVSLSCDLGFRAQSHSTRFAQLHFGSGPSQYRELVEIHPPRDGRSERRVTKEDSVVNPRTWW
jgi:hypothetical protein